MCGRFAFYSPKEEIEKQFHAAVCNDIKPYYNLTPAMLIPVIRQSETQDNTCSLLQWGLLPSFAKDKKLAQINARYETVHEKPFFRSSFQKRRCLILANGWYEWQKYDDKKQPYYFEDPQKKILPFAGIWSQNDALGHPIETAAIITCPAHDKLKTIHPRMPLLLNEQQAEKWLSQLTFSHISLDTLKQTYNTDIHYYPVSSYVNSPTHQGKQCLSPISDL